MPVLHLKDHRTSAARDPLGFRFPWVHRVHDDTGFGTPVPGPQALGVAVDTGRLLQPGDSVVFHCEGSDPHGRELRWWVHPYGVDPTPVVRGDRVDLTWIVEPVSNGPRVYVGIGMAADSRHHRQGGLHAEGYDGWVVFYYRVAPAAHSFGGRR